MVPFGKRGFRSVWRQPCKLVKCLVLYVLLWLVPVVSLQATVHPGPSIWGDLLLDEGGVQLTVEGAAGPLTTNLGLETLLLGPLSAEQESAVRAAALKVFSEQNPLVVDGKRITPVLRDMIIQDGTEDEQSWKSCRIVLFYPCSELPRRLSLTWSSFEGEGVEFIPVTVRKTTSGFPRMFSLWPDEPEYVWHADDLRLSHSRDVSPVQGLSHRLRVPLPSVLLSLLALGMIVLLVKKRAVKEPVSASALKITAIVLLLFTAWFARERGAVTLPWLSSSAVALPAPDQAKDIFDSLHRNIYASFEAETEDGIYDLLAMSVDATILDDLYADVFESLILREQGGAVCAVEEIEVLDGSVDEASYDEEGLAEFGVRWHWRVRGVVSHWGHVHRRTNTYRADYRIRHDGDSWKINSVKVLEHERNDDE